MSAGPRTVAIVCANDDTRRELESYLGRAGLNVRTTGAMSTRGMDLPHPSVVVFFPDEFLADDLRDEIERLRDESPGALCVIVTKQPTQYVANDRTVVIAKPAWGWTILDAIHVRSRD